MVTMTGKQYSKLEPDFSDYRKPVYFWPESESRDVLSAGIVGLTSCIAGLLPFLRRQLLEDRSIDHAFVSSLMFAFSCGSTAMFLHSKRPKSARMFKIAAAMWMSSALALFLSIIVRNHFQ